MWVATKNLGPIGSDFFGIQTDKLKVYVYKYAYMYTAEPIRSKLIEGYAIYLTFNELMNYVDIRVCIVYHG